MAAPHQESLQYAGRAIHIGWCKFVRAELHGILVWLPIENTISTFKFLQQVFFQVLFSESFKKIILKKIMFCYEVTYDDVGKKNKVPVLSKEAISHFGQLGNGLGKRSRPASASPSIPSL